MKNVTILTLATLFFLAAAGGYGFVVFSIQQGVDQIAAATESAETLSRRDALARSMELFLEDTINDRTSLSQFIAHDEDVVSVIELIESTARSEGVQLSISSVSVVSGGEWQHHEAVEVSFSATGSFAALTDFAAVLELLPAASRVEQVSLEASSGGSWFGAFRMLFVKEKL